MPNTVPAPYGRVTRRWTDLSDDERDSHAIRLVGTTAVGARIGEPDGAARYGQLVEAAAEGDPDALAWLAWSHRPTLTHRGHDLYRADPAEWGSTCLELLYTTACKAVAADVTSSQWCRRWMSQRLCSQLARHARKECDQFRRERTGLIEPVTTSSTSDWTPRARTSSLTRRSAGCWPATPPPDMVAISSSGLRRALVDALDQVDAATRDAFLTLADDDSPGRITEVADRHEITSVALRQRLHRARRLLQPQLASWMVAA